MSTRSPMRNHWWWRPGWRVGRSFYTWHITFADQPAVHQIADQYQPVLSKHSELDVIPTQWLHVTLQGIGFTDEVDRRDVDRIVASTRDRCADLENFTIELSAAQVDPEAVYLPIHPQEPLIELRRRLRSAIADIFGPEGVSESEGGFRAHLSLAYSNSDGPMEPIAESLNKHQIEPTPLLVRAVSLIDLNRDHTAYEWTDLAVVTWRD